MIPSSGSITMTGKTTLSATALTGTLNGQSFLGSTLLVLSGTTPPIALDGIRTAPFLFIGLTTYYPAGTRIIATESPVLYAISSFSWLANVLTMTVATLPQALLSTQKVTLSGLSISSLNGTYEASASGQTSTIIKVPLATDPLIANGASWATGLTGFARPGIVNTVAGTGNGALGYYTVNMASILTAGPGGLSTAMMTPVVIPSGTTHNFPLCGTTTTAFGNIILDGVGVTSITCTQLLGLSNLKGGKYITASGSGAAVDVLTLHHAAYNPLGLGT